MEEILKQIAQLNGLGYIEIEHHESFIIAKSREKGKYYLFNPKDLNPLEGSESEQIQVINKRTVFLVQNGTLNTFSISTAADCWNDW